MLSVHVDHHAVLVDPANPQKVWLGNDGGLHVSRPPPQAKTLVIGLARLLVLEGIVVSQGQFHQRPCRLIVLPCPLQ